MLINFFLSRITVKPGNNGYVKEELQFLCNYVHKCTRNKNTMFYRKGIKLAKPNKTMKWNEINKIKNILLFVFWFLLWSDIKSGTMVLTWFESTCGRGIWEVGGAFKEWGTKYSSASIRSSSSSSSRRLWKNLLWLGLGSFMRSSPEMTFSIIHWTSGTFHNFKQREVKQSPPVWRGISEGLVPCGWTLQRVL